jgi:Domain of unknown function (DUF222)/HNH endonuclease
MAGEVAVAAVEAAVAALAAVDLASEDHDALAAEVVRLRTALNAAESEWLRRVRAIDARGPSQATGYQGTAGWLRRTCRLSPAQAHAQVEVARRLAELPLTTRALAAGEISPAHARQIAAAAADIPPDVSPRLAEPALVQLARLVDPARLRRELAHLRHQWAPAAVAAEAEGVHVRRRLSIAETFDGMVAVDGLIDPEGGAVLLAAVTPLSGPAGPDDRRGPAQRRADALVELARRGLDHADLPTLGGERPHLTVIVDLATLERRAGSRAADTGWAGPLPGEAARRIACDAGVSRVIIDGTSQPLDVGRRTRTVPPAIRTALAVRDGGCAFPGCDRPPPWTDAHHVQHWSDGGPTCVENLVLLCRRHHRAVHEGGWRLALAPDGRWAVQPPSRAGPMTPSAA